MDRHPNARTSASLPPELRRTTVPQAVRAWIARVTGRPVTGVRRLAGASSTAVHVVRLEDGQRLVLRRYVWPGFLDDEPDAPRREVDALGFARRHGLVAPEVVASDPDGDEVGDGIPVLLMSRLAGRAVAVPDLEALAAVAASIHAVDAITLGHTWFAWYQGTVTGPPATSRRPILWKRAIEVWRHGTPTFEPRLCHRDFHPGNLLWSRGSLTGIVDWANACCGPWGCDLAHCRWNLTELTGDDAAADELVRAYERLTSRTYDPYWEVASSLEHSPEHWTAANVPAAERRLERALVDLGQWP